VRSIRLICRAIQSSGIAPRSRVVFGPPFYNGIGHLCFHRERPIGPADSQFAGCSISRSQRMSPLTGRSAAMLTAVGRQVWAVPADATLCPGLTCCDRSNGGSEPISPHAAQPLKSEMVLAPTSCHRSRSIYPFDFVRSASVMWRFDIKAATDGEPFQFTFVPVPITGAHIGEMAFDFLLGDCTNGCTARC